MLELNQLRAGNRIRMSICTELIVLKATEKRVTVAFVGESRKKFTYTWDGTGYKRQGQYLYADGVK